MKVGSLFSGIGGLDLGLERAGMDIIWQSEVEPYACRVLAHHWPDVPNLGDVTQIDWSGVERPDLICGGYPCQPFSLAGARQGEDDPRHLWPHFARALRVLRPEWALLENVPGHLSLGFDTVLADLASLGYDTEWESLPASAFGAPHLRWRVFVVAHANSQSEPGRSVDAVTGPGELVPHADGRGRGSGPWQFGGMGAEGPHPDVAHAESNERRLGDRDCEDDVADTGRVGGEPERGPGQLAGSDIQGCSAFPEQSGWGAVDRSGWWDVEPDVGRVAHGIPHRVDRLRTLGNAVVPQCAEWIGRRIMEAAA